MSRTQVILGSNGIAAEVDNYSKGVVSIQTEHEHIHDGMHFGAVSIDTDVDIATPKLWSVIAPNTTTRIHFIGQIDATKSGTVEFFESPTVTGAGTAVVAGNNDRNSDTVAELLVKEDTTVSANGTLIAGGVIGSDSTSAVGGSGGVLERNRELILLQGATYLLKFTAANDNTRVSLDLAWYEVPA